MIFRGYCVGRPGWFAMSAQAPHLFASEDSTQSAVPVRWEGRPVTARGPLEFRLVPFQTTEAHE